MLTLDVTTRVLLWLIPVVFAITLHEVAHGLCAYYLGDSTAKNQNRLSLNPIRHIDPIGSILIPLILVSFTNFVFGWAKPVPVIFQNLRQPKRDMIFVAAAGPAANAIMMLFWLFVFKLGYSDIIEHAVINDILVYSSVAGVLINCVLMMLNLLPLLPLDGGRILNGLLPVKFSLWHAKTERFGLPILIILIVSGLLQEPLMFLITLGINFFSWVTQVPIEPLGFALNMMLGLV